MNTVPQPLEILLLTNFSDYCFRVIPALAQLADEVPVSLTMLHTYDPRCSSGRQAREALDSFFPEADRYASCRRVVAAGALLGAVQRQISVDRAHLIVAPSSDPIGMPRIGDRSLRAQLIEASGVPLWTMGRGVSAETLARPVRQLACWLDFRDDHCRHLPYAIAMAERLGATLHLLHGLPPIDEGLLAPSGRADRALHPDRARDEIARLAAGTSAQVEIHVAQGDGHGTLKRLLRECRADLVFLRNDEGLVSRWFGLGLGLRLGDGAPCPAVYISDRPTVPVWRFGTARVPAPRRRAMTAPGHRAARSAVPLDDLATVGLA